MLRATAKTNHNVRKVSRSSETIQHQKFVQTKLLQLTKTWKHHKESFNLSSITLTKQNPAQKSTNKKVCTSCANMQFKMHVLIASETLFPVDIFTNPRFWSHPWNLNGTLNHICKTRAGHLAFSSFNMPNHFINIQLQFLIRMWTKFWEGYTTQQEMEC